MAVTETTGHVVARRLPGPDVVRAVALIGVVVMNFHGYLLLDDRNVDGVGTGWAAELFDPRQGPLSTRFAATFVLVAGVGVTLLTRSSIGDADRVREMRWRLVRRGVLLYVVGLLVDEIWDGTILPYYGAMFVIAAAVFTWRSRWLIVLGAATAFAAWGLSVWRFERTEDGHDTTWLTRPGESIRRFVFDTAINGTHPLLPWLAFLCAGMVLGRCLPRPWWRPAAFGAGFVLFTTATIVGADATTTPFRRVLLSTHPFDRGVVYVASALGTALVAYAAIDWLAERFPCGLDPLRRAGQMTLTLYLLHVAAFNVLVNWLGWIEPTGLDVALVFAVSFWIVAIAGAAAWQRRFGIGPAERVYRAFGG